METAETLAKHASVIEEEFPGVSPNFSRESPTAEQSKRNPESKKNWVRRLKLAGAIGATALMGITGIGGEVYAGDVFVGPKIAIEYVGQEQAPQVSAETVLKVKSELAQRSRIHEFLNSGADNSKRSEFEYASHPAEARGFHLADYPAFVKEARATENIDEFMNVLNRYTQESYGFGVNFPDHAGIPEWGLGVKTLPSRVIENPQNFPEIKDGLIALMEAYSFIPREIIQDSGLKEISLIEKIKAVYNGTNAAGEANPATDRIYLDPSIFSDPDNAKAAVHELGHIIDSHINGVRGMIHDPGFTHLNRIRFRYGKGGQDNVGYDVPDSYSEVNAAEDKADIYEDILMAIPNYVYAPQSSPEKAKAIYVLAVLETKYPGFTAYMNAITDR
jgi:hypothetical protein